jgi:zinc finger protein
MYPRPFFLLKNPLSRYSAYIAEGAAYTVQIETRKDLNRQIVRSETCEVVIPELELTLPPTSRAQLTTVEGLLRNIVSDLSFDQPLRRIQDQVGFKAIQSIIDQLKLILGDGEDEEESNTLTPFTIRLDDPAGNSFVEFDGSMADPRWNFKTYQRTLQQNVALGLASPDEETAKEAGRTQDAGGDEHINAPVSEDEVLIFPGICSSCAHSIETRMKKVNIPYFKVGQCLFHGWI